MRLYIHGRSMPPGCLALARWAGWSGFQVQATTSNFESGQTTSPLTRKGRKGGERREEGKKSQGGAEGKREGGSGTGDRAQGPLAKEEGLYLDICAGVLRVPSYATADGAGLPT